MISYFGTTNKPKMTLPSVEMGLGSKNILRDPPKGIFTRRIDKVGINNDILQQQEDSGSRFSECIRTYARGVNPMVSVSYTNDGSNGGGSVADYGTRSATNPRSLFPPGGGQFRPPVILPQDLIPLSRLPRLLTSADTNPQFIDFTKRMKCGDERHIEVREGAIKKLDIQPTRSYRLDTPLVEPFEIKYYIQNPLNVEVKGNIANRNMTAGAVNDHFTNDFVKEIHAKNITTNVSQRLDNHDYENYHDLNNKRNLPAYNYESNVSNNIYVNNIQEPVQKQQTRNTPLTEVFVNQKGDKVIDHSENVRDYRLNQRLDHGSIYTQGARPLLDRVAPLRPMMLKNSVRENAAKYQRDKNRYN